MNRWLFGILLLLLWGAPTVRATTYSGVMDKRVGFPLIAGFTAQSPSWFGGTTTGKGLRFEWTVDDTSNPGSWTYAYRLVRGVAVNKCSAFFDIETADDFTPANIRGWQVLSALDRSGNPIASGPGSITLSAPTGFTTVHDFTGDQATPGFNYLSKFDLSHYSGDPGIAAAGLSGGTASATPTAGPVPHPFFGLRWTFPGTGFDGYEPCAWAVELVTDRAPIWGDFFLWGDQTTQLPKWYANAFNDQIDNPVRESAPPADNLHAEYPGWILIPGPDTSPQNLSVLTGGSGYGRITSSPSGIDCGKDSPGNCTAVFPRGTTVDLTAQPDSFSLFNGWSGDCSGSNPMISVPMTLQVSCSACVWLNLNA